MSDIEKNDIPAPSKKRLNPYLKWGLILLPVIAIIGIVIWVLSILFPANLLKIVPADSDIVVAIDGEQILEASGVDISIFGVEYSENCQELLDYLEKDNNLNDLKASKCFDPRRIVFVANVNNSTDSSQSILLESYLLISLFDRDDAEEFITSLDSNFKISYKNDYSISKVGYNTFFVLNDDYCWLYKISHLANNNIPLDSNTELTEDDVAKRIDEIIRTASKKSISEDTHKRNILENGNAITACIDTKNFSEIANKELSNILPNVKFNDEKLALNARFEGMSFITEATLYDKEWKQIPISPNSKNINESCAKWLNDSDLFSIAFTINDDAPWDSTITGVENSIGTKFPLNEREQLLKLLTSIDGTIICACGIDNAIQLIRKKVNILFAIELKEGKEKEILEQIANLLPSINAQNIEYNDSIINSEIGNNKIKIQATNGKIIITTNRSIENDGSNVMKPEFFAGKSLASMIYLDKSNFISRYLDLDGNISLTTTCDHDKLLMRLDIQDINNNNYAGIIDFFIPSALKILGRF